MMSLNVCLDVVELVCSNLYTKKFLSLFKIRGRISEISRTTFFFCFDFVHEIYNSYANSHVNFVHEIRNFW